jgi:hypothetical protein
MWIDIVRGESRRIQMAHEMKCSSGIVPELDNQSVLEGPTIPLMIEDAESL